MLKHILPLNLSLFLSPTPVSSTVCSDGSLLILTAHLFPLFSRPLINQVWLSLEKMQLVVFDALFRVSVS